MVVLIRSDAEQQPASPELVSVTASLRLAPRSFTSRGVGICLLLSSSLSGLNYPTNVSPPRSQPGSLSTATVEPILEAQKNSALALDYSEKCF